MTNSTVTYTQELVGDLDVIPIYKDIMQASTEQGSIYIKAKETMQAMFDDGFIKDDGKALVISNILTGISTNLSQQAMDTALKIAIENRKGKYDLTLERENTKLVTAQAAQVEANIVKIEQEIKLEKMNGWTQQATLYRDFGINASQLATDTDIVPSGLYSEYGTKVATIAQAEASTASAWATTYRQNGNVLVAGKGIPTLSAGDSTGLVVAQTNVAIRQKAAFDDNERQHVVNSSASMISMLLGTEASGIDYTPYLTRWTTAADYLNTNH